MSDDEKTVTIWKYPFPIEDRFTLDIPKDAHVVHVGAQPHPESGEVPAMWVMVNPKAEKVPVEFFLLGTGHPIPEKVAESLIHLGSFFMAQGRLVWHLFAKIDMDDNDLALGAIWTKQVTPSE